MTLVFHFFSVFILIYLVQNIYYLEFLSLFLRLHLLNVYVFVYELTGCGFESSYLFLLLMFLLKRTGSYLISSQYSYHVETIFFDLHGKLTDWGSG